MKRIEIILISIAIISILISKGFGFGSVNVVFALAIIILMMLYTFFGFALFNGIRTRDIFKKEAYKDTKFIEIFIAIFLGISLAILIEGILFQVLDWHIVITDSLTLGGRILLSIGLISCAHYLIFYLIYYFNKRKQITKTVLIRIVFYLGIAAALYF